MKRLVSIIATMLILVGPPCFAAAKGADVPLNFDSQILRIFEAAQTADSEPFHEASPDDCATLARILKKLRRHQLALKNVVYRTDMQVLRITWADDHNDDVIKAAYKTGKDRILSNSLYADKGHVISVKIIYRNPRGAYSYLNLENINEMIKSNASPPGGAGAAQPPDDYATEGNKTNAPEPGKAGAAPPLYNYAIEGNPSNEKCGFCHVLAKNDGEPSGLFFPRYQESHADPDIKVDNIFHLDAFLPQEASSAQKLGLPAMQENFLLRKVENAYSPYPPPEEVRLFRTLIELPQLIEVMARDNRQSLCVLAQFAGGDVAAQFSGSYVCADNAAQRLYVHLVNPLLTAHKGPMDYSEPYFEKK